MYVGGVRLSGRGTLLLVGMVALVCVPHRATAQGREVTTVYSPINASSVAVDATGTRYVAEWTGGRVVTVAPDGTVATLATVGTPLAGIAVAPSGTVYVTDIYLHTVLQITAGGVITTLAGGTKGAADGQGAAAQFYYPSGLALDAAGMLYVADRDNHRIRRIDPATGEVTTVAGSTLGWFDAQGTSAQFNTPTAVAVDAAGVIYVADAGNARIRKIATDGTVTTLAGSAQGFADGTGAEARFATAWGIAVDAAGWVYVGDMGYANGDFYAIGEGNQRVRQVSPEGVVTTVAGSGVYGLRDGSAETAWFRQPNGLAVSSTGVVWVADQANYRLRQVAATGPAPTITSVTPAHGPAGGGTTVTIAGSGFASGASVAFGALPATEVTVVDASTITCRVPAHAAGAVTVAVRNPDGQLATVPDGFTYEPPQALTVTRIGTGLGSVVSDPAGVECGATCEHAFDYGTEVVLSATPALGSTFTGWSGGGCSGTGTCTVAMTAATAVTATFTLNAYSLTVTRVGTGSGGVTSTAPAGAVDCGATCAATVDHGTSVTLTAAPAVGSTFAGWSGGGCSGTGACTVAMTGATAVTATFTLNAYSLTVTRVGTGSGRVTSTTPVGVVDCGATCAATLDHGTSVTLTASPVVGSTFAGWSGGGCSGTGACTVAMTAATAVTATFTLNAYSLTVTRVGTGSGGVTSTTPAGVVDCGATCAATVDHGTSVTLTATPAAGSTFAGWSGGGCSGTGACTVAMTAATAVTATFTLNAYSLTVTRVGTGSGGVTSTTPAGVVDCGATCAATLDHGTSVTLSAAPATGSTFIGWSGACSGVDSCSVVMDQVRSVTATFDLGPVIHTRYLAEGATSAVFDTRLALVNPGDTATTAALSFLQAGKAPVALQVPVPARTRVTVDPKAIPGLATAEFSTKVESDQPLVVDRTMSWSNGEAYGAHAETAVASPALTWYLAEGATHSSFNLFYLLQNPNASDATVRVRYLRPGGAPLEKTYTLPPDSRTNIWVDFEEFPGLGTALASTDVSAVFEVQNGQPIIVERAMYADVPGQFFGAGHESAGITAPASEWFLAEGATGRYFDLFVLIANPGAADAQVEATFLLPDGTTLVRPYTAAANSRFNIWVNHEDPGLADTAVSTTIRSTNGVPVIVERSMWWPGGGWHEAHNAPGATTTGTRWALAEGEVDPSRNLETYILVANTSSTPADVQVTLLFEDGTTAAQTYAGVPAKSRFNVPVGLFFPQAAGRRFGAIVETVGTVPAEIVVERAMYWDADGQQWAAGTNALATRLR